MIRSKDSLVPDWKRVKTVRTIRVEIQGEEVWFELNIDEHAGYYIYKANHDPEDRVYHETVVFTSSISIPDIGEGCGVQTDAVLNPGYDQENNPTCRGMFESLTEAGLVGMSQLTGRLFPPELTLTVPDPEETPE